MAFAIVAMGLTAVVLTIRAADDLVNGFGATSATIIDGNGREQSIRCHGPTSFEYFEIRRGPSDEPDGPPPGAVDACRHKYDQFVSGRWRTNAAALGLVALAGFLIRRSERGLHSPGDG